MSSVIEWNSSLGGLGEPLPTSEKQALAQRIADITRGKFGACFTSVKNSQPVPTTQALSTGTKVAIGVGAGVGLLAVIAWFRR